MSTLPLDTPVKQISFSPQKAVNSRIQALLGRMKIKTLADLTARRANELKCPTGYDDRFDRIVGKSLAHVQTKLAEMGLKLKDSATPDQVQQ